MASTLIIPSAVFALIATLSVNILANALPLGGYSTGQMSAMYPTLMTPPGVTFMIWIVIYGLLILFLVTQIFFRQSVDLKNIITYFLLSCAFNIGWIFLWHYRMIVPATFSIIGLWYCLMQIYKMTRGSEIITKSTFSIYFAWITIATIVSLFVVVKTLSGGAPVTPIEPRGITSSKSGYGSILTTKERVDSFTITIDKNGDFSDMKGVTLLAENNGDFVGDGTWMDRIMISEKTEQTVDPDFSFGVRPGEVLISGGNPEIVSYVGTVEYILTNIAILVAGILAILAIIYYKDVLFALTIVWAVGGIMFKVINSYTPDKLLIGVSAFTLMMILVGMTLKLIKVK